MNLDELLKKTRISMTVDVIDCCSSRNKTVDCRCLDYLTWQSVPQICCSIEEEVFSVLLPCDFFEIFEAVTSPFIGDDMEKIEFF